MPHESGIDDGVSERSIGGHTVGVKSNESVVGNHNEDILDNVTICVPTFERPECLRRLLESIRKYYHSVKIFVADNGKKRTAFDVAKEFKARYELLPFDVGVSAVRNFLVRNATTEHVFFVDDDLAFNDRTNLISLKHKLRKTGCDLIGIGVINNSILCNYSGKLFKFNRDLVRVGIPYKNYGDVQIYDVVSNIFMANRDKLLTVPWNEQLKFSELVEFFWRAKGKLVVGLTLKIMIDHFHDTDDYYQQFRDRANEYIVKANELMGIDRRYRNDKIERVWAKKNIQK